MKQEDGSERVLTFDLPLPVPLVAALTRAIADALEVLGWTDVRYHQEGYVLARPPERAAVANALLVEAMEKATVAAIVRALTRLEDEHSDRKDRMTVELQASVVAAYLDVDGYAVPGGADRLALALQEALDEVEENGHFASMEALAEFVHRRLLARGRD